MRLVIYKNDIIYSLKQRFFEQIIKNEFTRT